MSFMNDPCRDTRFGEPDAPTPAPVETPRTDANEFFMSTSDNHSPDEGCMMVEAFFARTLERELASAQAEIARLTKLYNDRQDGFAAIEKIVGRQQHETVYEAARRLVARVSAAEQQACEAVAALAAAQADKELLANAAEEVLDSFIIGKMVEAGHPCPENMVICHTLRSLIDAARAQEGGAK